MIDNKYIHKEIFQHHRTSLLEVSFDAVLEHIYHQLEEVLITYLVHPFLHIDLIRVDYHYYRHNNNQYCKHIVLFEFRRIQQQRQYE